MHKKNSKIKTKKAKNDDNEIDDDDTKTDSEMIEIITRLYLAWQKIATVDLIISAWKQAGAQYICGGPSFTYIKFDPYSSRCYKELCKQWETENAQTNLMAASKFEEFKKLFSPPGQDTTEKKKNQNTELKSKINISEFNTQDFKSKIKALKQTYEDTIQNSTIKI